jgi:23S rRNA G2445 N2-methylase RlmL
VSFHSEHGSIKRFSVEAGKNHASRHKKIFSRMSFSFRVTCPVGLETLLRAELMSLIPSLSMAGGSLRGAVDFCTPVNRFTPESNIVDNILGTVSLKSRLSSAIFLQIGDTFRATWEIQVREGLERVPWGICFDSTSGVPPLMVKSLRSRIRAPSHVRSLVSECFPKQDEFKERDVSERAQGGQRARLNVLINDDHFRVLVDAGGDFLTDRLPIQPFRSRFRPIVSYQIAAACTRTAFSKVLDDLCSPTVIWDPFAGSGILSLTAVHVITGVPPGSPYVPYPFRDFPSHVEKSFNSISQGLILDAHEKIGLIERLVASESSVDAARITNENLLRFYNALPLTSGEKVVPFPISVERYPEAYSPPRDSRIAIMTALPCGDESERRYNRFHGMLESLAERLVGCVVITSKPKQFKKLSRRKWVTDLRVHDGRRFLECLRLVL